MNRALTQDKDSAASEHEDARQAEAQEKAATVLKIREMEEKVEELQGKTEAQEQEKAAQDARLKELETKEADLLA